MTNAACRIPLCPAFAAPGRQTCKVHAFAKKASRDSTCVKCGRKISRETDDGKGDWVLVCKTAKLESVHEQHAVCPTAPPVAQRKHRTPQGLFELLDEGRR